MVRAIGINHVALEVGDLSEALEWYGRFFEFELRGKKPGMAWIDLGDQFVAMAEGRTQEADESRHLGLVVDDKERMRTMLRDAGVDVPDDGFLDFLDPWGNHIQVVDYREIQFTKAPEVMRAMGLEDLEKSESARTELRERGIEAG